MYNIFDTQNNNIAENYKKKEEPENKVPFSITKCSQEDGDIKFSHVIVLFIFP